MALVTTTHLFQASSFLPLLASGWPSSRLTLCICDGCKPTKT